ncbi:MAG: anion transporter [bacterium]
MSWIYLIITFIILSGIAIGHYPLLKMNRATIALVGAVLLISIGAIPLKQAYFSIDFDTIVLLFSMMVINVNLSLAGFFQIVAVKVGYWAKTPKQLLALIVLFSGLLSALFLNDTICIMFTPLILEIAIALKRNPIPYLMGLATAANIGSSATIIGNPQNMLIGIASKISFLEFMYMQLPVALVGLFFVWIVIVLIYKNEFKKQNFTEKPDIKIRIYKPLLIKSIITTIIMIILFFAGVSIPLAALIGASSLLTTRRLKPHRVFREIDWSLLVFFSGLFIITGAINYIGLGDVFFNLLKPLSGENVASLSLISVVLSNLISNVPAVLLYLPIIPSFIDPHKAWLVLAMSSTLAGNVTLLGSVANLIVAEAAKKRGVNLSFVEYLKAGLPIAVFSLLWGIVWFSIF